MELATVLYSKCYTVRSNNLTNFVYSYFQIRHLSPRLDSSGLCLCSNNHFHDQNCAHRSQRPPKQSFENLEYKIVKDLFCHLNMPKNKQEMMQTILEVWHEVSLTPKVPYQNCQNCQNLPISISCLRILNVNIIRWIQL